MIRELLSEEYKRFPKHWKIVPFNEAFQDKTGGQTKIQRKDYLENGEIPIIDQGQDLIGGYTNENHSICKINLPCIIFGDHTKIFKFITQPFALGADGVKVLYHADNINSKFAYYFLKTLDLPDVGYSRHFRFLKRTFFPIPPIAEQKRIAAILDKADRVRRKRKEAIRLTEELLRSVFLEMFGDPVTNPKGWEIKPLEEIADLLTGYPFKSQEYVGSAEGIRLCRGANVLPDVIGWSDVCYWNSKELNQYQRFSLEVKDIVIALDRPWISSGLKIAVVTSSDLPTLLVQRVARIRPYQIEMQFYLYLLLRHPAFEKHCCLTETTIPHISPRDLRTYLVPVPSIEHLQKFNSFIDKTLSAGMISKSQYKEMENLFNSLLQRAFRGEL